MSKNDIIAKYVREKCPEILTSVDFNLYRLSMACREFANNAVEVLKKIDFSELAELVKENEDNEQ